MNYYNYNMQMPQIPQINYGRPVGSPIFYTSEEEIKGGVLAPSSQVMAIDKEKPILYIKSNDSMGRSTFEKFEFKKIEDTPQMQVEYAKLEDLNKFVSKKDFEMFSKKVLAEIEKQKESKNEQFTKSSNANGK